MPVKKWQKKFSFWAHILRCIYAKKKKQTPSGQTGCLSNPESLLAAQESSFSIHFLSLTQLVRAPLVPYDLLSSTCMTYRTSYHSIGHQVLSTQPLPREAQDFPRGRKYPKDVPLLTSHLKVLPGRFYLGPRASHGNYISLSLVLNQLLNSLIVWMLLVFTNRPYSLLIICSL